MRTPFALFALVVIAISGTAVYAQLVPKVGYDGTIYEPSPLRVSNMILTNPNITVTTNGALIVTSGSPSTPVAGQIVTTGSSMRLYLTGTTGVEFKAGTNAPF